MMSLLLICINSGCAHLTAGQKLMLAVGTWVAVSNPSEFSDRMKPKTTSRKPSPYQPSESHTAAHSVRTIKRINGDDYLEKALWEYRQANYNRAADFLVRAINTGDLSKANERKAYLHFGAALYLMHKTNEAMDMFRQAKKLGVSGMPCTTFTPEMIQLFNES